MTPCGHRRMSGRIPMRFPRDLWPLRHSVCRRKAPARTRIPAGLNPPRALRCGLVPVPLRRGSPRRLLVRVDVHPCKHALLHAAESVREDGSPASLPWRTSTRSPYCSPRASVSFVETRMWCAATMSRLRTIQPWVFSPTVSVPSRCSLSRTGVSMPGTKLPVQDAPIRVRSRSGRRMATRRNFPGGPARVTRSSAASYWVGADVLRVSA